MPYRGLRRHSADQSGQSRRTQPHDLLAARTRGDLAPLVADLPGTTTTQPPRPSRTLPPIAPVIPLAILLVAIWAPTGAGYFWPIGAMLVGGMKHAACRPRTVITRRR